jgi:hypothetical protein
MDGFDEAKAGICVRFGQEPIMAYDYNKVISILMGDDDMNYDEAVEYFEFNIIGAWVGEDTPCFIVAEEDFILDY